MNRLLVILISVVLVLLLGVGLLAYFLTHSNQDAPEHQNKNTAATLLNKSDDKSCGLPAADSIAAQEKVTINSAAFLPAIVSIKVGQTVRWVNQDTVSHQVATDPYPLNDACNGFISEVLQPNQEFGFTFTKAGTWGYHDQKSPSWQAKVIVTE